ncbi:MAG: ABC transporter ATP-binding protein [Halothiobacillaceae bacterium]
MTGHAIVIENLRYGWPGQPRPVLDIERFRVGRGEQVFLSGPSGSGKSTLLNLLTGILATPGKGQLQVLGEDIGLLGGRARDQFRADHVGYIFQMFNLVPYLGVLDNILLPCRFSKQRRQRLRNPVAEAMELLGRLGLEESLARRPVQSLSVGQQQRVAAARAMIGHPELIVADEPTSALDQTARNIFLQQLLSQSRSQGSTLVFVSHDLTLQAPFDRVVQLPEISTAANDIQTEAFT